MNEEVSHTWSPSPAGVADEFSNFLDFDDVDLTFPGGSAVDARVDGNEDVMDMSTNEFAQDLASSHLSTPASTAFSSGECISDATLQRSSFRHPDQTGNETSRVGLEYMAPQGQKGRLNGYYRHGMVPPTPNSTELHGSQVHAYTDPQALGIYEAGKHQEQMVFTPLVSPAFQLHEFNTSGEYFSPLTSPALQAQDYSRNVMLPSAGPDIDKRDFQVTGASTKKAKRRSAAGGRDPVHSIRSSPAMKARQKRHSGGGKTPKEVADIVTGLGTLRQASPRAGPDSKVSTQRSHASSETGSISPEPLSDVLMPPPAVPRSSSSGKSDQQSPQQLSVNGPLHNIPATPASLFRISKPSSAEVEKLASSRAPALTGSLLTSQTLAPSDDAPVSNDQVSADLQLASATQELESDALTPSSIGISGDVVGNTLRSSTVATSKDQSAQTRSTRKKSSSSQASPALRPRISPSIKPLLPGGTGYDSEATAVLLANKSNYERIIDGSASQFGVNFPAQLSENLTSKRTSHKLAEQGRRNRINTALAEIQALLPDGFGRDTVESSATNPSSTASSSGASKAKTVENAIAYIKQLRTELADTKAELAVLRDPASQAILKDASTLDK